MVISQARDPGVKTGLSLLAGAMTIDALWTHDIRMLLAAVSVYAIWPLISDEIGDDFPVCSGCGKGAVIPGCPIHDPQERRTPVAENTEAVQTTREKGSSFVAS